MIKKPAILVADDEKNLCGVITSILLKEGYRVEKAENGRMALNKIRKKKFDILVSDIVMPGLSGLELLEEAKKLHPEMPVVLLTGKASMDQAIDAVNKGAYYFLTKPFKKEELKLAIKKALEMLEIKKENDFLKQELRSSYDFDNIIGKSRKIQHVFGLVEKVAPTDSTVLILGESGTGKELFAKAIHYHSTRFSKPFLELNCGAVPESLLESELFGHVKGSFTGAIRDKEGLFLTAKDGSIFLDEIGETSQAIQVKLLRVLQEREIFPVGSTRRQPVLARVIAASNRNLQESMEEGNFRSDLFYRLNVFPITLPPLRDRMDDVPLLTDHFLRKSCLKQNSDYKELTDEAMDCLMNYNWPGNVRELENVVERAVILQDGPQIEIEALPDELFNKRKSRMAFNLNKEFPTLDSLEKKYILEVLTNTGWKKNTASKVLGIDASTLYRKIKKYQLFGSSELTVE